MKSATTVFASATQAARVLLAGLIMSASVIGGISTATAASSITAISPTTAVPSGRLLIEGTGFGMTQGAGQVDISGTTAIVTRWSDTLIAAYVPEQTQADTVATVQVTTADGTSNPVGVSVAARGSSGHVKWRFQADSDYILQRPAVGPDGTIIAHDAGGFVYALSPSGGLKWIRKTRVFAAGPPSVGADGSVYVADSSTITAINPDGSVKWEFTEPPGGQGVMAGPTVGPDGNIYAITDQGGLGAISLTPAGELLWSNTGSPVMQEIGQTGAEIVFGASASGGAADRFYAVFDNATTDVRNHLYAFRMTGTQAWAVPLWMTKYTAMMYQQQPQVGPDGTVFVSAIIPIEGSWSLNAYDPASGFLRGSYYPSPGSGMSNPSVGPDGAVYFSHTLQYLQSLSASLAPRWQVSDGSMIFNTVVSPTNKLVFAVVQPANGVPGEARAYNPLNGAVLWTQNLGSENGFNIVLDGRARFTPDGNTVYSGSSLAGQSSNAYSYLYAFDATSASAVSVASLGVNPSTVTGGTSSQGTVVLTGAAPAGGAILALTSSNSSVAKVPASVTIAAGSGSASFTISTKKVTATTSVEIGASYAGVLKSATLTVTRFDQIFKNTFE